MKRNFLILILVCAIIASCNGPASDTANTSYMFMSDAMHSGQQTSSPVLTEPHLLWKFQTGNKVVSSPVIQKGVLFIGSSDSKLYALDAKTGERKWSFPTGGEICSSPLVKDGQVCFLSYDGYFYALKASTGDLLWKFKTGGEKTFMVKDYFNGQFEADFWDFYLSSAVEDKGTIYFGSSDYHIYALDFKKGEMKWKYKTSGSIHSSPAISEGRLLIGSWDSRVYCIDAISGKENWVFTTGRDTAAFIHIGIQASPAADQEVVFIGSRDGKLYGLDLSSGNTMWVNSNFEGSWMPSTAAIGEDYLAVGSSDASKFYCIDKLSGEIRFSLPTNTYTFSSPALVDNMAYIGAANGRLYGIDIEKRDLAWVFRTDASIADTSGFYDNEGRVNMDQLMAMAQTRQITDMPGLTNLYEDMFKSAGAILSSPAVRDQIIYFGSSDGCVYAITDLTDQN